MTMAHTSPQHRRFTFNRDDLLRGSVIALLVVLCILTTILAFALQIDILITQIFFIPIIYAVYAFPRRGIIVSAICACAYEITGTYTFILIPWSSFPLPFRQVLFVGIAGIIAYLIERLHSREMQYRTVFEYSQLGIVVFDEHTEAIQHCNRKFADMLHFTGKDCRP